MNPKVFKHADLQAILGHAKDFLKELQPGARLPDMGRALTDNERMVLSYLDGMLTVLGSYGITTAAVKVICEIPDSDTVD